jgi:predicted nucleotidyltransferase
VSAADEPLLDRARIRELFTRLGERLQRRGVVGDVYVIGGAAMALAYDARRATRDIDAVIRSHGIVLDEAHALAAELGLPQWWLNEQASAYVAPGGDPQAPLSFDHPGLRVSTASPEHLLAMKTLAARRRDIDDLRLLVGRLGLTTPEEVIAVCTRVFPDETLPDRARLLLEDLFEGIGRAEEAGA